MECAHLIPKVVMESHYRDFRGGSSNPACASARSTVSSVIKPRAQARNDKLEKPKWE